jgi:hypothetical protein
MQAALTKSRGSDERWHLKKDGARFWASGEMMPLKDDSGTVQGFLKILRDRTKRRAAEQRQRFLMQELEHRVKNTLAVVMAISSQTFRGDVSFADARDSFNARLVALSHAHDVLMQGSWTEAKLRTLVEDAARMHRSEDVERFHIEGPDITIGPKAARIFRDPGFRAWLRRGAGTIQPARHVITSWREVSGSEHRNRHRSAPVDIRVPEATSERYISGEPS